MSNFIEYIDQIDKKVMVLLNSQHAVWLDPIMIFATKKWTWLPFYVLLLALLILKYKKQVLPYIIALVLTIVAADQIASGICKPYFKRLRPCHQEVLKPYLHILDPHAGQYGFISSHASNSFGVAVFLGLVLGGGWRLWFMLAWASLVSYSRIYVGVHFPLDIFFGGLVGVMCGLGFYHLVMWVQYKKLQSHD
jgi:undecaprenyl-diphosphatase